MLNGNKLNGWGKILLTTGAVVFAVSSIFGAGMLWQKVNTHLSNSERHQSIGEKNVLIDERVLLRLRPIEVQIEEMDKKLDYLVNGMHEETRRANP